MTPDLPTLALPPVEAIVQLTTARYCCGIVIRNGIVVEAAPIARRWALGLSEAQAQREAARRGVLWSRVGA